MLSQADSALRCVRLVAALETCVTVTMPPNATSVAATAMIRRRPLNQPEFLDARRYLDLRMRDTFLCRPGRGFRGLPRPEDAHCRDDAGHEGDGEDKKDHGGVDTRDPAG